LFWGGGAGLEYCFVLLGGSGGGRVLLWIASTMLLYVHTPFG
jgi:hypothetical protein